jgi:hypothetical protein
MQCVTDLVKLRDSIISRVERLRQIVAPITAPLGSEDRRALAFVTIELDNLVIVGLRQYAKSSLLRSRTAAGVRITATVQPASTEEAAAFIYRSINPKGYANRLKSPLKILEKDEIPVRDPKTMERVLMDYSASNLPNFALALSLNADVFSEAKLCRHFFAHRSKNTYEAVRVFAANLGIVGRDMPENLILRGRPGTGVRFLDGWLADVENFFDLAT